MERAHQVLPSARSIPVLPPMLLSTCAISDVGTPIQSMPRIQLAAAKPARSPTTPPPSAAIVSPRSSPIAASADHSRASTRGDLLRSPAGTTTEPTSKPARTSEARARVR
jgi:hypothetical protein